MLVIKVELHSAITGKISRLATMFICNDASGNRKRGNYTFAVFRKGQKPEEDMYAKRTLPQPLRQGGLADYPRLSLPVWCLVKRALEKLDYN